MGQLINASDSHFFVYGVNITCSLPASGCESLQLSSLTPYNSSSHILNSTVTLNCTSTDPHFAATSIYVNSPVAGNLAGNLTLACSDTRASLEPIDFSDTTASYETLDSNNYGYSITNNVTSCSNGSFICGIRTMMVLSRVFNLPSYVHYFYDIQSICCQSLF